MKFIHIYLKGSDLCEVDRNSAGKSELSWACQGCKHIRIDVPLPSIKILKETLMDIPISGLNVGNTMVVRKDFVHALNGLVLEQLDFGELLDEANNVIEGFVTVRAKHYTWMRGKENVSIRKCECCGRVLYYASGKRYLCGHSFDENSVLSSDLSGLVFPENIFESLNFNFPKKSTVIEKLEVLDSPRDGLPLDLNQWNGTPITSRDWTRRRI
jgi:hypothetical protein